MSATVWKFTLPITDEVPLQMPVGAKVLSIGKDPTSDRLAIWAHVKPESPTEWRTFYVRGTGHEMWDAQVAGFVGTVIDPPFVWHIFEAQR